MAIVSASTPLNMTNGLDIGQWLAEQTIADAFKIQGTSAGPNFTYRGIYRGDFVTVGGQAQSGTINSYEAYKLGVGYQMQYKLMGLNMTLAQFINAKNTLSGSELTAWLLRGNDTLNGSTVGDRLFGWDGADTVKANGGNDYMYGGLGADTLSGGPGNDALTGGNAKDRMTGGSGKDIFDFNSTAESGPYSGSRDIITDFARGQDRIDLSGIDANTKASGNNAFTKIISASAAFTSAGQLKISGDVLYINTDGDAAAELSIQLSGITQLSLSDFIL